MLAMAFGREIYSGGWWFQGEEGITKESHAAAPGRGRNLSESGRGSSSKREKEGKKHSSAKISEKTPLCLLIAWYVRFFTIPEGAEIERELKERSPV